MFSTILGIIITDSYFAYKYEYDNNIYAYQQNEHMERLNYFGYLRRLSHELIFNDYFDSIRIVSGLRSADTSPQQKSVQPLPTLRELHKTQFIRNKISMKYDISTDEGKQKLVAYQLQCKLCHNKASNYCSGCSDPDNGHFFPFCSTRTKRNCWATHLRNVHNIVVDEEL